jgi:hypothetical protein
MEATAASILSYLFGGYLSLEQLAERSGVPADRIAELIDARCVPPHSHEARLTLAVASEVTPKLQIPESRIRFYHPSLVRWVKAAEDLARTRGLEAVADQVRARFLAELEESFNADEKAIPRLAERHWRALMAGIHGICLRDVTARSMVLKQRAVAVVTRLLQEVSGSELDAAQAREFEAALEQYEAVAGPFGPHEIAQSSRGRVVEAARARFGWRNPAFSRCFVSG